MNPTPQRAIKTTWKVELKQHSAIHTSGLVLPAGETAAFDPFLIMAEDKFQSAAFGHHPHRGMETVTYVIEGELIHDDNKGGHGVLHPGDAQWMTAGSGLIHLEAPPEDSTVHTLQLWVNLPRANKMTPPRYQDITSEHVVVRREAGATYRVYSGNSGSAVSSTKNYAPVTMVEIQVEAGHSASQDLPADYTGFLYVLEGAGVFGSNQVTAGKGEVVLLAALPEQAGASELTFTATERLRVVFYAGRPLHEPVVARGPFVMNTEEEIEQAYADYRAGKF